MTLLKPQWVLNSEIHRETCANFGNLFMDMKFISESEPIIFRRSANMQDKANPRRKND